MKFAISREWCAEKAKAEAGAEISAGLPSIAPVFSGEEGYAFAPYDSRETFGRFVHLSRRRLKFSREALAEKAGIALAELRNIEEDAGYKPAPRTICQLAGIFKVDQEKLMALSGLTQPENTARVEEAAPHIARSDSPEDLNDQELTLLEEMVSELRKS